MANIICEVCNNQMDNWEISPTDVLSRCPECHHIMRDLEQCNANAREHAWGGSGIFDKIRNYLTFNKIKKIIPNGKVLNILEIGFGYGDILSKFLKQGHNIFGIDADMLQTNLSEELKQSGNFIYDKFENVTLPNDKFDLIYGIHVIEHIDDSKHIFKKCFSALNDNGILFFMTPNADSEGLKKYKSAWWNLEDPTHIRFFSPQSISIMLQDAGFKNIQTSVPIWDSVSVEINSWIRQLNSKKTKNGVFSSKLLQLWIMVIMPFYILRRVLNPKISPTLMIIATKQ